VGHEFIGECPLSNGDLAFETYEGELAIKYIKQECGPPPRGVDIEITSEGCEVGNEGHELSYPVISVVWDDSVIEYPDEYIEKCSDAFERFDLPEEIYLEGRLLVELFAQTPKLPDSD
jgi:hypothetical protein